MQNYEAKTNYFVLIKDLQNFVIMVTTEFRLKNPKSLLHHVSCISTFYAFNLITFIQSNWFNSDKRINQKIFIYF